MNYMNCNSVEKGIWMICWWENR